METASAFQYQPVKRNRYEALAILKCYQRSCCPRTSVTASVRSASEFEYVYKTELLWRTENAPIGPIRSDWVVVGSRAQQRWYGDTNKCFFRASWLGQTQWYHQDTILALQGPDSTLFDLEHEPWPPTFEHGPNVRGVVGVRQPKSLRR